MSWNSLACSELVESADLKSICSMAFALIPRQNILRIPGLPPSAVTEDHGDSLDHVHPRRQVLGRQIFPKKTIDAAGGHYAAGIELSAPMTAPCVGFAPSRRSSGTPKASHTDESAHIGHNRSQGGRRAAHESEGRPRAIADARFPCLSPTSIWSRSVYICEQDIRDIVCASLSTRIIEQQIVGCHEPQDVRGATAFRRTRPVSETVSYEANFRVQEPPSRLRSCMCPITTKQGGRSGCTRWFDVTSRTRRRALTESEERFRSIANSAPVPIWVTRMDGLREFVNRAYQEFLGVLSWRRWILIGARRCIPMISAAYCANRRRENPRTCPSRSRRDTGVATVNGAGYARNRSLAGARVGTTSDLSGSPMMSPHRERPS